MSASVALSIGEEVVADLPLPGAEVVAAEADLRELLAVDDARVGRPDPAARRVDDARVLGGGQPAVPARVPSAHDVGRRPSRPNRRGMRPMIVQPTRPSASATTRFWCGMPTSGRGPAPRRGRRPTSMRTSAAFSPPSRERHPGERPAAAARRLSVTGPQIVVRPRASPPCSFTSIVSVALERPRALGREVGVGVRRVGLEDDEVGPVALAVREAPRHVAVAARRRRRGAPGRVTPVTRRSLSRRPFRPGEDERGAVPGVRHRDAEVHVVGDDRAAVRGARRRPPSCCCRGSSTDSKRRGVGSGRARRGGRRVGAASEVDDLGPGNGTLANGSLEAARPTRCRGRRGTRRAVPAARRASAPRSTRGRILGVVQVRNMWTASTESSGRHARGSIARRTYSNGRPGAREAGVDTRRVGLEERALLGGGMPSRPAGQRRAAAARGILAIATGSSRAADQLRQLAGRASSQQVHLEEAVLRVEEADRPGDVEAIPRATSERRARRARRGFSPRAAET